MKVRKAGTWILTLALMTAMLGGCGGGGNSGSANSSASTAQTEASTGASASTEASEEAAPAEEASTAEAASTAEETSTAEEASAAEEASSAEEASAAEETTAADEGASDTATEGESHAGRLIAFVESADGSPEATGTWMEMNDDGTGTFCLDGTEYGITYTTEESNDNGLTDGGMIYVIEVEDGAKLQGFFLGLGMFQCIAVDEFMPADELLMYEGAEEEIYMMVEEGSEMWNMMMGE